MKKHTGFISTLLVTVLLSNTILASTNVLAQTTVDPNATSQPATATTLPTNFKVFLQLAETQGQAQSQIAYQIIDQQTQTIVYSYQVPGTTNTTGPLSLGPGHYIFRLVDGGQFQREGQSIQPGQVQLANPQAGQPAIEMTDSGQMVTDPQGNIYYDYDFQIDESILSQFQKLDYSIYLIGDQVQSGLYPAAMTEAEFQAGQSESTTTTDLARESTTTILADQSQTTTVADATSTVAGTGTIDIQVKDAQGLPHANYELLLNNKPYTTDVQGQILLENVEPGDYVLQAIPDATGFEAFDKTTLQVTADQITQVNLDLPAATSTTEETTTTAESTTTTEATTSETTTTEETTTTLAHQALNLRLVDEAGQGLPGAQIKIDGVTYDFDAQGQLTIDDLKYGDLAYEIIGLPAGYQAETTGTITYSALAIDHVIKATKLTQADATITVKDEAGQGLAGVTLQLNQKDFVSDAQGVITVPDLAFGDHDFTITSSPKGYEKDVTGQIQLTADSHKFDVTLKKAIEYGQVTIKVEDQEGNVVTDTSVTLDGQTFPANAAGEIIVQELVANKDHTYQLVTYPENYQYTGKTETFQLKAEEDKQITIKVERKIAPSILQMTLVDQDQKPVAGATIKVGDQKVATDAQGQVELKDLQAGDYSYEVIDLPEGYKGTASGQVNLTEGETASETLAIERIVKPGAITFKAVDQDKKALAGVEITIGDQTATTDEQGQVTFDDLAPSEYGYEVVSAPEEYAGGPRVGILTVEEAKTTDQTLAYEKQAKVGRANITIVDSQSNVVKNAEIEVAGQTVKTDDQGQAQVDLPVGTQEVKVTKVPTGYTMSSTTQKIEVKQNQTVNVEVKTNSVPTESTTSTQEATTVEPTTTTQKPSMQVNQSQQVIVNGNQQNQAGTTTTVGQGQATTTNNQSQPITVTKKGNTNPKQADSKLPHTGETSPIVIYIAAAILLIAGFFFFFKKGKK